MFFLRPKSNYEKSNSITKVKFYISKKTKKLAWQLLHSEETIQRQRISDLLLEELSLLAGVKPVTVKISHNKQVHKKTNGRVSYKQYGFYRPGSHHIYITNRTAVRGQFLAPKTFTDTLLHEWMHHYDFGKLKINSIHTAGFYARLKDLKEKVGYFET
ncbi:MAG: hypothetical protein ABII02_01520 [Candidatus Magasanikbacteria bacterium]